MARFRWKKTFWRFTLLVLVGALIACGAYYEYLDRLVSHQFEGRRWTLPAHVYASPLELYARLDVALRPALFADESRPAFILSIKCGGSAIENLTDSAGKELPLVRLEPLLIGSIF